MRTPGTTTLALAACLLMAGCGGKDKKTEDADADPDAIEDPAGEDVTPDETDPTGDPTEEEPAGPCAGTDTVTIQALNLNTDDPIEGVVFALRCQDEVWEATTGSDGLVSFAGLDITSNTVDFTAIHDGMAASMLGYGGSRAVPDPLPLHFGQQEFEDIEIMSGDVTHTTYMNYHFLALEGGARQITSVTRYELGSPVDTDLRMFAFEYSTDGDTATMIGYDVITYDFPTGGGDGPAVDFTSAGTGWGSDSIALTFDIGTESVFRTMVAPRDTDWSRQYQGIMFQGKWELERWTFFGFTTSWTGDWDAGVTAEVAWAPEGFTLSGEDVVTALLLFNPTFSAWYHGRLPTDPSTWTSHTVHDFPAMAGFTGTTNAFDTEITVSYPTTGTGALMQYHVRASGRYAIPTDGVEVYWVILTHPETTSFRLTDVVWPSTVAYSDVIPSEETLRIGYQAGTYDADPYDGYAAFTDPDWGMDHLLELWIDSRYPLSHP